MIIQFPNQDIKKARLLLKRAENLTTVIKNSESFFINNSTYKSFKDSIDNCNYAVKALSIAIESKKIAQDDLSTLDKFIYGMERCAYSMQQYI